MPPQVDTHLIDIHPPNDRRATWLATCSLKDFSQSYRNRVEAFRAGSAHVSEVMLVNELIRGTYEFDDGS